MCQLVGANIHLFKFDSRILEEMLTLDLFFRNPIDPKNEHVHTEKV